VWTINQTTGLLTETGTGSNPDDHYTMASNKTFIAGTQHSIGSSHPGLFIAQKKVDGVSYANADLQSKYFTFHQLMVGASSGWSYAVGSTNSAGLATLSTHLSSAGSESVGATDVTFTVDSNGIVTAGGSIGTLTGFLSADKKTIVATATEGTGPYYYHLYVINITTGQDSSATSQVAGTSYNYILAAGASSPAPFWAHQTISITSGGVMSFDYWVCSNSLVLGPSGTETISIGTSGIATLAGSSVPETTFHGQLSYDGKFMVSTQTFDPGVYSLMVIVK
jgi:hypothetical protein